MEMPVDILNRRLGKIRDNGDIDFDNTMAAVDIDSELQEKFIFFADDELSELAEQVEESRGLLTLGQGRGYVSMTAEISVEDAYTRAENALAVYWYVKRTAEMKAEDERLERERLAKRPMPGLYLTRTKLCTVTMVVTNDQRVLTVRDNGQLNDSTQTYDDLAAEGRLTTEWEMRRVDVPLEAWSE